MSAASELVAILGVSTAASIAYALAGIAGVVLISVVFYLVGRGEDRERERAAAQRRADAGDEADAEPEASPARPRAPRSARERRRR